MAEDNNIQNNRSIQYQIGPKTTYAKHDTAHCLAPGLFRSFKKGERKKQKLHVIYRFGEKEFLEFRGFEPLDGDDLVVMQGLAAMAGIQKQILTANPKTEHGEILREKLELKWEAVRQSTVVVKSSFRKLAREIGFDPDSGGDLKTIMKAVDRLGAVSSVVQIGNERYGFNLLSSCRINLKTGELLVALNPRLAHAIFGGKPFSRINMDEVRKLKSSPARILHQRLCALIAQGATKKIFPDTLISYIWPDEATGSTLRTRRQVLKKSLAEIAATGAWEIKEGYEISRKGDFEKKKLPKKKKIKKVSE